jgi:uncharacterized protein YdhG (YjbR/CyaY superfamily)
MTPPSGPAKDIDAYLADVPEPARAVLEKLRSTIRAAVPEATETISYRLPTFKHRGRPLVAFGASRDHCAFYLMSYLPPEHEAELEKYDTAKGTIRFPPEKPLPAALVRKLVKSRIAQLEAGETYGRGTGS